MSPRLIVVGPLPPPYHGVTVSTGLVLVNRKLAERFAVEHLDVSDHRSWHNTGRWDFRNVLLAASAILRLAARLRGEPGVVYLPLSQSTAALLRDCLFVQMAVVRGWKVAAHLRGGEFNDVYQLQNRFMRRLVRSSLENVDSVAVLGASLRNVFDGLVDPERLAVVPNGTPEVQLDGVPRDARTGLFLSNLRRRKGVVEAVEAALIVVGEDSEARFLFVGEWEDERLEQAVRDRAGSAGDRIRFLPVATGEAQRRALGSAGFLVFPPLEPEGHPRVVLEALAAGLPVITTDRGAIAETVVDGESGFIVSDAAPSEIAERMLRLIRDPALHERMSRAARARYVDRYTQDAADGCLADWLERVASDRDRKGG